ncbi:hypothetical protein [Mycobacterium marseillense]|uniref:hypothetical protein n=1 Tax=Mycobacterium marseillense TaxID=701042 RepID=UPI00119E4AEE|nr:hypothetical protein [Mycobacterium marseillense]
MRRVLTTVAALAAAITLATPAHADNPPPWLDPHYPDNARGSCPGGGGGYGFGWCNGTPYPDGTYWQQRVTGGILNVPPVASKPECMGPDNQPAPPGGCGGFG